MDACLVPSSDMVAGYSGTPTLAAMRRWTRRGPRATDRFTNLTSLLEHCSEKRSQQVIHVWDRSFAGGPYEAPVPEPYVGAGSSWSLPQRRPTTVHCSASVRES